jgi:thiol-disulfide isomerase/thioredoxin
MRHVLIPVLALGASIGFASAQSNEELAKQVQELARRVEQLEQRLAPSATAKPPAATTAGDGREEAMALYTRIDGLVAAGQVDQARQELAAWDAAHAGTPQAAWTRALGRELAVVGKPAPADWSIDHWFQGESEVVLDGAKPTLVVFWEAWCPHCRDEVPKLAKLREQFSIQGLQMVGVTRITKTATEDSVRSFLSESGVQYPMAKETGQLAEYFDVKGIPAAALVKDGRIVWRGHPMRLTDDLMNEALR